MSMEFVTVRADAETVRAFDEEAKRLGTSRSGLLRELMVAVKDCYGIISAKKMGKLPAFKKLEDKAAEWLIENMPDKLSPEMLFVIGGVFHLIANDMMGIKKSNRLVISETEVKDIVKDLKAFNEEE